MERTNDQLYPLSIELDATTRRLVVRFESSAEMLEASPISYDGPPSELLGQGPGRENGHGSATASRS